MATESFFSNASLAYLASAGAGKDGKTYSIKPSDGTGDFTFSRGSNLTATRVGPTGLIEKGRENLLLQSNAFSTSPWATSVASVTGGQSGYDGTNDAWLLEKSDINGRIFQFISTSGVQTFSVYAKAAVNDWAFLLVNGGGNPAAWFDLSTGSLGSAVGGVISHNISDVGNGWYKISITYNETISRVRIYVGDANNDNSGTSGSIYIQDAQLEIGLAATDYIESGATTGKAGLLEDEPRFDYSGGATCPSLLLEPSRTNLIQQSEYLTKYPFYSSDVTISYNAAISPEGVQNACEFAFPGTGSDFAYLNTAYTTTGASVFSVYMRVASGTKSVSLRTWTTGVFNAVNVTTEWQRFELNFSSALSGDRIGIDNRVTYGGSGTAGTIEVWGAQMEEGSYSTSYIPNHSGGTITRGADDCSVTGVSSLIGQTEGTLFIEWEQQLSDAYAMYGFNDGLNNNALRLLLNSGGLPRLGLVYLVNSTSHYSNLNIQGLNVGTIYKAALVYTQTTLKVYLNGSEVVNQTGFSASGGVFNELNFKLNSTSSSFPFTMPVNQALVFPEALSDADCITLTTI